MFCPKCGNQLEGNERFCSNCGSAIGIHTQYPVQKPQQKNENNGQVLTPPTVLRKKKGKKTQFLLISGIALIVIIVFVAISNNSSNSGYYHNEGDYGEEVQNNDESNFVSSEIGESASVSLDLSGYSAHGSWNCGMMWVERTSSSYDSAPVTEFAYIDESGVVKSKWFSSSGWNKSDFCNGLLVLRGTPPYTYSSKYPSELYCSVYDTDFNLIISVNAVTCRVALSTNKYETVISDADTNGNVFAIGTRVGDYNDDKSLFMINNNGVVRFDLPSNYLAGVGLNALKSIVRYDSGYYIILIRDPVINSVFYTAVFDNNGALVIHPRAAMGGYQVNSIDIISDNEIKVIFEGRDKKMYSANIDFSGIFLSEPTTIN